MSHNDSRKRVILGVPFFAGDLESALEASAAGGLVVAPSGPGLADLDRDLVYRDAVENADIALTDSGYLMLLWRWKTGESLERVSGLRFFDKLLDHKSFEKGRSAFWVMPSEREQETNREFLKTRGIHVEPHDCYLAPFYPANRVEDEQLLELLRRKQPRFIILNIGGGPQEKLGRWLRDRLEHRPTIICTGAAIAFLSGTQANIPPWADRLYLGWLMRIMQSPKKFFPRYWRSLRLARLVWRHADKPVR